MSKARYFGSSLHVGVGDTVLLGDPRNIIGDYPKGEMTVIDVKRRYGAINDGTTKQYPLVALLDPETGKKHYFDNSYIVKVVSRGSGSKDLPKNIYRDILEEEQAFWRTTRKGTWSGRLEGLTRMALGYLPIELTRPIASARLKELYFKQCRGLIGRDCLGGIVVHKKPFRRWVEQNVSRLIMTVAELERHETRIRQMWEDDWRADFEKGMRRDAEHDEFCSGDRDDGMGIFSGYSDDEFEADSDLIAAATGQP